MAKNVKTNILIKPVVNEKSERLSEKLGKYTFIVDKKANKVEIRKEVEAMFGVSVTSVNTLIMPAKERSRFTRTGVLKGQTSSRKKAIVTLAEGDTIELFGEV
jgi:large subunit ribosomal protein L23